MAPDTTQPDPTTNMDSSVSDLERIFAAQKNSFAQAPFPDHQERTLRLDTMIAAITDHEEKIVAAISRDFGNRSPFESTLSEIIISIAAAKNARKNLKSWMKPRKVSTPLHLFPAKSRLVPQPLGVVGILSPWNYPMQLALAPASAALAAGNRVLIKPSELAPRTSALLKEIFSRVFDETILSVVTGGVDIGRTFSELPFDHLLFTGSSTTGQKVAQAAAKNLTPVTLELGGKSPAIVDPSANFAKAGYSIAQGKTFNAGQTCVAPDYVIAPASARDELVAAILDGANKLFPEIESTQDYTSIISDRHFARLTALIEDARTKGAKIIEVGSPEQLRSQRKVPLTLVVDPAPDTNLLHEEIFGPVLPIISTASVDETVAFINKGDHPLALYWYGEDADARHEILSRTHAGGVTINDCLLHAAQESLPFGGVGRSGMGAYRGKYGFDTFSHLKPVLYQNRFSVTEKIHPPYSEATNKVIKLIRKII